MTPKEWNTVGHYLRENRISISYNIQIGTFSIVKHSALYYIDYQSEQHLNLSDAIQEFERMKEKENK